MAVLARADIDGRGRGVLGAAGLGYTLGASWQLAAGALLGKTLGARVGLERFVGHGPLQLILGVSAPTFFSGAAVALPAAARERRAWPVSDSGLRHGRAAREWACGATKVALRSRSGQALDR